MREILQTLQQRFSVNDIEKRSHSMQLLTVARRDAVALIDFLRTSGGFSHLVLMTAVDWLEEGVFQLSYILNNRTEKCDIVVRVRIDRDDAVMDSIHRLWPAAETYQRELREMFGIDFPGSPGVDESFILEGWDGPPPYRRDFDTKQYSEETYFPRPGRETADPEKHMKKKLYPEE